MDWKYCPTQKKKRKEKLTCKGVPMMCVASTASALEPSSTEFCSKGSSIRNSRHHAFSASSNLLASTFLTFCCSYAIHCSVFGHENRTMSAITCGKEAEQRDRGGETWLCATSTLSPRRCTRLINRGKGIELNRRTCCRDSNGFDSGEYKDLPCVGDKQK